MPHRRLVKIGETPALPTISQFLTEMAARQHDEIVRLKREALEMGRLPDAALTDETHANLVPDPWQLHPVRLKKAPSRPKGKKVKSKAKVARKAKPAKKSAAKGVPKRKKKASSPRKSASKRR